MSFIKTIESIKEALDEKITLKLGTRKYSLVRQGSIYSIHGDGVRMSMMTKDYKVAVKRFVEVVEKAMVQAKQDIYKALQDYNNDLADCNKKLEQLYKSIKED